MKATTQMKTQTRIPKLFSVDQIAHQFEVSSKTVRRWIEAGDLRAHRMGRQVRILEEDALMFVAARRR